MKYQSFNNKKKYNKNKTFKNKFAYQTGGTESSLVSIINATPNSRIIGPKENMYPSSYIGYTVFVPPESKPFTLAQLVNDALEEGHFLNADKSIDLIKLNEQFMNDSFRMNLFINNTRTFNSFKDKITNTNTNTNTNINESNNTFVKQLTELQPITELEVFTTKLLEIFPKLNVKENEIKCIQDFANKNNWTILPNYWAFLPFYDQIVNETGITDQAKLDNIKVLSQQNISKTMMDILMKFVSLPSIFHDTLQLGGSFKTFGNKMNDYISQIPTAPLIDIDITKSNTIIQNKLYFSLVNIPNEFGLAVISTCIYADFQKNEVFMIWKIERWRNQVIKKFYHFIIELSNKGITISEHLLESMQTYIYNNKISDNYPQTHEGLLEYFMKNSNLNKNDVDTINKLVKEELSKNTSDNDNSNLIKSQVLSRQDTPSKGDKDSESEIETQEEPSTQKESTPNVKPIEYVSQENLIELQKPENVSDEQLANDEETINRDETEMEEAKENIVNTIEQYNRDEQQLRDDQPSPSDTDKLTNTLATLGSVTALGAIGSGLYFAAPLLVLGGSKKNKRKYKKSKRTRRK